MPMIGGDHFVFFQPIFNVADASLSVSVIVLILFYARYLVLESNRADAQSDQQAIDDNNDNPSNPEMNA